MISFIFFFSALFYIIFLAFSFLFGTVISVLDALRETVTKLFLTVLYGGLGTLALYLIYEIISGIVTEGVLAIIGYIIVFALELLLAWLLLGWLGKLLFGLISVIVEWIYNILFTIFLKLSKAFYSAAYFFLNGIIKRLDKL